MKFLRVIISLLRFDRTNWTALALCLCAAAVFWIFNALNKDYDTQLSLPLRLEYDQSRFAPAQAIPARLEVNIHGNGWELLRKSLGYKVPVISVPLERPAGIHRIPGSALAPGVVSQLGPLKLNFVALDTLRLWLEPRTTRKLKLVADIRRVTYRDNMGRISPVVVLPDSVLLEGPENYLRALPDTLVIQLPSRRVTAQYRESLEVRLENGEFIRRDPPVAEVMFDVGAMTVLSLRLPVSRPSGLMSDRDSVAVSVRLPIRDRERFNQEVAGIATQIPALTLQKGQSLRVAPQVQGLPDYASLVSVDSVELKKRLP
ncbi:MAG: hypothetical protein JNN04_16675 [Cyclobacteriaceae bacterium]|nr:hypothetical protein [Cyclobacteriaceae bacterium]